MNGKLILVYDYLFCAECDQVIPSRNLSEVHFIKAPNHRKQPQTARLTLQYITCILYVVFIGSIHLLNIMESTETSR